jgi:hypothetical protein
MVVVDHRLRGRVVVERIHREVAPRGIFGDRAEDVVAQHAAVLVLDRMGIVRGAEGGHLQRLAALHDMHDLEAAADDAGAAEQARAPAPAWHRWRCRNPWDRCRRSGRAPRRRRCRPCARLLQGFAGPARADRNVVATNAVARHGNHGRLAVEMDSPRRNTRRNSLRIMETGGTGHGGLALEGGNDSPNPRPPQIYAGRGDGLPLKLPLLLPRKTYGTRQELRTRRHRAALVPDLGVARLFRRRPRHRQDGQFLHPAAAAERHRHPAHGPRLQPGDHGFADALPPHARRQHPVAAGHRPRRHRDADRGRTPARRPGHLAPRPRDARNSSKRSGSGRNTRATPSPSRCAGWAPRPTGRANASRWTPGCRRSSPRPSSASTTRA